MIKRTQTEIMQNWGVDNSENPLVSVRCITFNHEKYISQAIDSFLMQETNFPFEIVIHDDASIDHTADIIREYEAKYPKIVKPIYETENQHSKHDGSIRRIMQKACKGKYIAYCEGDDYWISKDKLQKQADYLSKHEDIVAICCRYNIYDEILNKSFLGPSYYFDNPIHSTEYFFEFDLKYNYLRQWTTKTLTMMYRKDILDKANLNLEYKDLRYKRDVHTNYYILGQGNCVCLNFIGGVYRRNDTSTFGSLSEKEQSLTNYLLYRDFYKAERSLVLRYALRKNRWKYLINYSDLWGWCKKVLILCNRAYLFMCRKFKLNKIILDYFL